MQLHRWTAAIIAFVTAAPLLAAGPARAPGPATAPARPNIVIILADDMGYGDASCFNPGSKIPTPHINRLAGAGVRFTDCHAPGSVCIPSRYGLLTGRYPFRNQRDFDKQCLIEPGRMTLAGLLKKAGYSTAMIGKWHLSFEGGAAHFTDDKPLEGGPIDHGFDRFFGLHASLDIPPYFYIEDEREVEAPTARIDDHHTPGVSPIQGAFWRGGAIAPHFEHAQVLPTLAGKAVELIESRKGKEQPFFLYLALPAPHTPWLPGPAFQGKSKAGMYGDYAVEVDDVVGRILAAMERAGKTQDTLVVFTSDNGPVWYDVDEKRYDHRSAGGFRGMKGDAWEGGHRMPFVARWPGRVPADASCADLICFTDLLATFAHLTGQALPDDAGEDSLDFSAALFGANQKPARDALVMQTSRGLLAIRAGNWKLIPQLGSGGFSQPAKVKPAPGEPEGQLYDLAKDPGEQDNLYAREPEVVQRLTALLKQQQSASRTRPLSERR